MEEAADEDLAERKFYRDGKEFEGLANDSLEAVLVDGVADGVLVRSCLRRVNSGEGQQAFEQCGSQLFDLLVGSSVFEGSRLCADPPHLPDYLC